MKNKKIESITEQARSQGILKISTCDAPNWNREEHDAMLLLQVHPPDDLSISYVNNYGVCDWTIIVREPAEQTANERLRNAAPIMLEALLFVKNVLVNAKKGQYDGVTMRTINNAIDKATK